MVKRQYSPAAKISYLPFIILTFQVVANKPVHVVAKPVVVFLRLPLLSPEELKTVEEENEKDGLIPVRIKLSIETFKCCSCKREDLPKAGYCIRRTCWMVFSGSTKCLQLVLSESRMFQLLPNVFQLLGFPTCILVVQIIHRLYQLYAHFYLHYT